MASLPTYPTAALIVRTSKTGTFYEAKFRVPGVDGHAKQVLRRIGPAWLDRGPDVIRNGKPVPAWVSRKGRVPDGYYDDRRAHAAAERIVAAYVSGAEAEAKAEAERKARPITFRELAADYLDNLARIMDAKPSTLADHRLLLAEPGTPARRGPGTLRGTIMAAFGDRPAASITQDDVEALLEQIDQPNMSARTVNKSRALLSAIYGYGLRKGARYGLPGNPVKYAEKRKESHAGQLDYYSVEQIEALARAFEQEDRPNSDISPILDAEAVRVSAYAGLRMGELLALRWRDVKFADAKIVVSRAMSAGVEQATTKTGRVREVPLVRPAAEALARIGQRSNFTEPDDIVFASVIGRHIDGSALRRRYRRTQATAQVPLLRWHDLRHTYGSLLAADGVDLVRIKAALGHTAITTTERYLHARSASTEAERFSRAFASTRAPDAQPVHNGERGEDR